MRSANIKRWLGWLGLVVVFSVACSLLANWQFNRREEALAKIAQVQANYDQPAVALEALAEIDSFAKKNEWRPVSLSGHYLPDSAVLVRNRPYNGSPGFLQLIPFELDSGKIIAIETGWLPTGSKQDYPDLVPLPSADETTIIARVRPTEPSLNRDAPAGQIGTINIQLLLEKISLEKPIYQKVYVRATANYSGEQSPKILPKPQLTEGNHLSYALQWIVFALMALFALGWAIRKELEFKKMQTDPTYKPKMRKRLGDTDKEAEDSLLD